MMSEDDFARRRREHDNLKSAIPGAPKAVYRAALHKPGTGRKSRLYRIDPLGLSQWRCEVWIGAAIHRTVIVATRTHMLELRQQYEREVAELSLDGWTVDA